ncbi:MAG: hypothetical protein R2771_07270 [Saprospiraceae bacterium]
MVKGLLSGLVTFCICEIELVLNNMLNNMNSGRISSLIELGNVIEVSLIMGNEDVNFLNSNIALQRMK